MILWRTLFIVNTSDMQWYIGIRLLTSIVRVANVRSYGKETIRNSIVWEAMPRKKFEKI